MGRKEGDITDRQKITWNSIWIVGKRGHLNALSVVMKQGKGRGFQGKLLEEQAQGRGQSWAWKKEGRSSREDNWICSTVVQKRPASWKIEIWGSCCVNITEAMRNGGAYSERDQAKKKGVGERNNQVGSIMKSDVHLRTHNIYFQELVGYYIIVFSVSNSSLYTQHGVLGCRPHFSFAHRAVGDA